jgi:hypothetical protein
VLAAFGNIGAVDVVERPVLANQDNHVLDRRRRGLMMRAVIGVLLRSCRDARPVGS